MGIGTLSAITVLSDFLGTAITLWLGIYLITHSEANKMALRMVGTLFALSIFYFNSFYSGSQNLPMNANITVFALALALLGVYHITYFLLPENTQNKFAWVKWMLSILTILIPVILLSFGKASNFDFLYIIKLSSQNPIIAPSLVQLCIAIGIAVNITIIFRSQYQSFHIPLYSALALGLIAISFGAFGTFTTYEMPRFIATVLVLLATLSLGYSMARYQSFIQRRVLYQDLPLSTLGIIIIGGLFSLLAWSFNNSVKETGIFIFLAIATHSLFSAGKGKMTRMLYKEEKENRKEIRQILDNVRDNSSLANDLNNGLTILCKNLKASGGFIALKQSQFFEVVATSDSIDLGTQLKIEDVIIDAITPAREKLTGQADWIAPIYNESNQVGVIGIGKLEGYRAYSDDDLDWVEEVADQLALIIFSHTKSNSKPDANILKDLEERPNKDLIKDVEFGFRNYHDFIGLGNSSLVHLLPSNNGKNHIEMGKEVQQLLLASLEILKPAGERPKKPIPKAWWYYVILHDAYVEDVPDREIMARIFVAEGTFYRSRRKAIRGIARVLSE